MDGNEDEEEEEEKKNVLTVGRVDWPSAVIAPRWLTTTTAQSDCLYANDFQFEAQEAPAAFQRPVDVVSQSEEERI